MKFRQIFISVIFIAILKIQDLTQQTYQCPEGRLPKLHLFLEHRLDLNEKKEFRPQMVCHL